VAARPKPDIVTTDAGLAEACARLAAAGRFAFDTEFVAEASYRPQICLIQAATDDDCVLIDPIDGLDAGPFWQLVADPGIETIVHAGAEDLALCYQIIGKPPARVFDVQIAAGFVGMGYPLSLMRLVRQTSRARLHKSQTLTDWRVRPLTSDQIAYAAEDVMYLPHAYSILCAQLDRLGRRRWVEEECAAIWAPAVRGVEGVDGEPKIRKLKGAGALTPQELAIADAILEERDKLARQYDRPARAVLKDHLLVELARRGWTDPRRMRTLRGINLSDAALRRIATVIEQAKRIPRDQLPDVEVVEENPELDVLISLASTVLRDYSNRSGIALALLANKQDTRTFVSHFLSAGPAAAPSSLSNGWRRESVGGLLENILSGQSAVRVHCENGRRVLETE
jgi:ribonuclease D